MKRILLLVLLVASATTFAQNNFFGNISTTDQYKRFTSVLDMDRDGQCDVTKPDLIVKFRLGFLPSGEGYKCEAIIQEGSSKGKELIRMDALHAYSTCSGYPYESYMRQKTTKHALVALDGYVFELSEFSEEDFTFMGVPNVYIRMDDDGASSEEPEEKKEKMSMKDKLKALKDGAGTVNYGPLHAELESKQLVEYLTNYLTEMKAKQDGRTAAELKKDDNLEAAKNQDEADIQAYNDSIRETPEYQKLKEHQARMEEMDNQSSTEMVTISNRTGSDIYIYKEGSRNSTTIRVNSSAKFDCSFGYTYKSDPNSSGSGSNCYNANSGCGASVTVN